LDTLKKIFSPVWKIWFLIWFIIPFLLLFPFFYVSLVTRSFNVVFFFKRIWSGFISYGSFLFPKIKYLSKQKQPKPCIYVGNHTSYLDIVFSTFYIQHTAVYLGKAELLKIPLFNQFFKYLDVPVNRKSITESHKSLQVCAQKLDEGLSVVIFPEGTISNEGKLKPFKNGAFKLAIDKQVPIIPVAYLNNWKFLQNGGFLKSNGCFGIPRIIVGEAIETKGLTEKDLPELKERIFKFVEGHLNQYNGRKSKRNHN
jgi:1-acyl-sn-glycerol-3-phosphate acyltransferase